MRGEAEVPNNTFVLSAPYKGLGGPHRLGVSGVVDQPPVEGLDPTAKRIEVVMWREPLGDGSRHRSALVDSPLGLGSPLQGGTGRGGRIERIPELVEEVRRHQRGRR